MSALGGALLTAAGLMAGVFAARSLRARLSGCGELLRMLSLMAFELERFCTPLPELFSGLGTQLDGQAGALCRTAAAALWRGGGSFGDIWREALRELPPAEREILLPLGGVLGRYGAPEELSAVAAAQRAMQAHCARLEACVREKGRVYIGLGTAAGLMLAVLLI